MFYSTCFGITETGISDIFCLSIFSADGQLEEGKVSLAEGLIRFLEPSGCHQPASSSHQLLLHSYASEIKKNLSKLTQNGRKSQFLSQLSVLV